MNRSSGDLPVYFPVFTEREPVEVTIPSFFLTVISTSSCSLKFLWIFDDVIPNCSICEVNLLLTPKV